MYAIGYVIYGVPWSDSLGEKINEAFDQDESIDEEEYDPGDIESLGFETKYSGSSDGPVGWVGKKYTTIDECNNFSLTELMSELESNRETFEKDYEEALKNVPEFVRNVLDKPDLYVVWGTS